MSDYTELLQNMRVCCGDTDIEECGEVCLQPQDSRNGELRWCRQWLIKDAISAIEALQAECHNLQVHTDYCESERDAWKVEVERLQAECDAAVADLKTVFGKCSYCKFFKQGAFGGQCQSTPNPGKCWQWRGVQHDGEKED